MRKSFKLAALAGALSITMSGATMAADLNFGGWEATNGTIDMSGSICGDVNFECSTVADGAGFSQVQVSLSPAGRGAAFEDTGLISGESYIMTVVTDQTASGTGGSGALAFEDVSFIKMRISLGGNNSNENGISAQQSIRETTGTANSAGFTLFESDTTINTGWSKGPNTTPIVISQSVVDNGFLAGTGDDFTSAFAYSQETDDNGIKSGFTMAIDQIAGLQSADATSLDDVQTFALRQREGTMLTDAGGPISLGGNNGGAVDWVAGENIKAIWLGQKINLGSAATIAGALGSNFGYLAFDKVGDTDTNGAQIAPISEFGFSASEADSAWVWDTAFDIGTNSGTPNICDPSGATICP